MNQSAQNRILGYLPDDVPPPGQIILLGLQHVLTMFPATVLVALLVGFHVSTVLMASGLATIVALLGARWGIGHFIPLYYGSSFSYIAATLAITNASFGQVASDDLIAAAQAGIVVTGLVNVAIGLIIRLTGGKKTIDKVLPPIVTGSVAAVIGLALGFAALDMASGTCCGAGGAGTWWMTAIVTLLATILFSVYLQGRGFIGMLPVLLGAIAGYVVAIPLGLVDFAPLTSASLITAPHITFPNFGHELALTAIVSIAIMAIATIPESTAHLYQISLYVDHLAEELGKPRLRLSRFIGFNLILDGLGDMVNGLLGGVAGTNYGENNSLMVITRNYSGPALLAAGIIAILLSFSGTLAGAIATVPTAVSGGLAIYLFGVIGMQGIALIMSEKVNLFDPRQLAIGATILVVGIGGHIGFEGGFLPIPLFASIFPNGWPAIATGAVAGIFLNAIFIAFPPPQVRPAVELPVEPIAEPAGD
ncbi:MAG: solute carrier family 23 protein [Anaerolineae bacterium]|nr:solute carrier family 23 protein [Anaerolineae bacterium]